jgi:pimeloyl-ACP methyl ester carboxylesterase
MLHYSSFLFITTLFFSSLQLAATEPKKECCAKSDFFNTKFLTDYDTVAKALVNEEGFKPVSFCATDNVKLEGLFKKVENAKRTIIFCAGFFPGKKEGLATFAKMVPENVNILFFDARGHGNSQGRFWTNVHNYGVDEYKDVQGAVEFVRKSDETNPITIFGTCAGAYHAAIAVAQTDCKKAKIDGLIFDSGFPSMLKVKTVPGRHLKEKVWPPLLRKWLYKNDTKEQVKQRYLCRFVSYVTNQIFKGLSAILTKRYELREKTMNLINRVKEISCPVLYIHSQDDDYSPIDAIKQLADQTTTKECWWIEKPSEHATHHLKHTAEYQAKLQAFINRCSMQ